MKCCVIIIKYLYHNIFIVSNKQKMYKWWIHTCIKIILTSRITEKSVRILDIQQSFIIIKHVIIDSLLIDTAKNIRGIIIPYKNILMISV